MKSLYILLVLIAISQCQVCLQSTGSYNIRSSPCGGIIGSLANGERTAYRASQAPATCTMSGQSYTFVPIAKGNGFVVNTALSVCSGACVKVNADTLNVRSSPCGGVSSSLAQGRTDTVASTTLTTASCFGRVYAWVNLGQGYAAADFLAPCSGGTGPNPPPPPSNGCNSNQKPTAIGQNGLNLIKRFEGKRNCWYRDPVGYPTICYGHLIVSGDPYRSGTCLSDQQCEDLLRVKDVPKYSNCVKSYITAPLNQNQFDALTSFTFNLGCGTLQSSTLRTKLNAGNYGAVCGELKRFVYAGGRVLQGLVTRRNAECDLFNSCAGVKVAGTYRECLEADSCVSCLLNSDNDATFSLLEGMGRNTTCSASNWQSLSDEWCNSINPWECYWKVPSNFVNATEAKCPMCAPRAEPTVPQPPNDESVNCTNTIGDMCVDVNCDAVLQGSKCDPATGNCIIGAFPKRDLPLCNPPPLTEESSAVIMTLNFLLIAIVAALI